MEEKNKYKNYILIGVFVLLVFILVFVLQKDNSSNSGFNDRKYKIIDVPSTFFTIENAVNKYINALSNKNVEDILTLLNDEYENNNLINKENVLSKLDNLDGRYSLRVKKIYREKVSSDVSKYYVFGYLTLEVMDEYKTGKDYYLIMDVNLDNNIFSITPYDGKLFEEVQ